MALNFVGSAVEPDLMFLPWGLPLVDWPDEYVVALPRGISRHVVRFTRVGTSVFAVKEIDAGLAEREYELLRELNNLGIPSVTPTGVVQGRVRQNGEELPAALVTHHLPFSLPYRAVFSGTLRADTTVRLLDALALLLVRLHLVGFAWKDCSLSNTLFRRDAGAFAAYLVDAETGELRPSLSDGVRWYDLDTATMNIAGELLDVQAAGKLQHDIDPVETALDLRPRYEALWSLVTEPVHISRGRRHELDAHIRRLNEIGFDVAQLQVVATDDGSRVTVSVKVVEAGHHSRRLMRLTGLDVQENQARRLLNDMDAFRAAQPNGHDDAPEDEQVSAHRWVTKVFEPVVNAVPLDLRGKLEPAEIFHEVLEHRWFLSEGAGYDVGVTAAVASYVDDILAGKPDEQAVLGSRTGGVSDDTQEIRLVLPPS